MPGPFLNRLSSLRVVTTTLLVTVVLLASLVMNTAFAQTPAAVENPTSEVVVAEEIAAPEPAPSDVAPEPTAIPPTVAPAPTEIIPTPTQIAPTPTEVPPTPTPIVTSAPTAAPTVVAKPTIAPTATVRASGGISIQSIVAGSGCSQVSTTDVVPAGTAVEYRCNGANGPGGSSVTRTFSNLTAGWEYQVNNEAWRSTVGPVFSQADLIAAFTVRLRPTANVVPGTHGAITVTLTTSNGSGGAHTTTMGATRLVEVAPTANDLQLSCSPSSVSAQVGSSQVIMCSYTAKASLGTRQITLTRVTVPAPAGWAITSPVGTVSASTLTILPNTVISYNATGGQSYTFTYTITPACTATTTAQSRILTSAFTHQTTANIAGATFTQQASRLNTSTLAVSVSRNSLIWNETYSFTDTVVSGNLVYLIAASGCSGWNVQIAASPFQYIGPHNGSTIPPSNLQLIQAGSPIVYSGTAAGVTPQATGGPMGAPIKVLNATAGAGNGTYEQQLDFNLTIPGKSRAGTYQSTITVTSTAAP